MPSKLDLQLVANPYNKTCLYRSFFYKLREHCCNGDPPTVDFNGDGVGKEARPYGKIIPAIAYQSFITA